MKERGILYSGPMVRALLDNRKTQTRRVVKRRSVLKDDGRTWKWGIPDRDGPREVAPRQAYRRRWDLLNAKHGTGWDANPWVWVLTFRRLTDG